MTDTCPVISAVNTGLSELTAQPSPTSPTSVSSADSGTSTASGGGSSGGSGRCGGGGGAWRPRRALRPAVMPTPDPCLPHTSITNSNKTFPSSEEYQSAVKELLGRANRNLRRKDLLRAEFESVYGAAQPVWRYELPARQGWAAFPDAAARALETAWCEGAEGASVLDAHGDLHRITFQSMQYATQLGIAECMGQVQRQVACTRPPQLTPRRAKAHAIMTLQTPDLADFMMLP